MGSAARRVVLGLGSNLGDREASIDDAIARLSGDEVRVLARSPLYESPPAGGPPQGDYLNGAILVETTLDARALLARALDVEREGGRTRPDAVRWGPRTIDIDILWIESTAIDEPDLRVPHPRLRERAFALRPLLDVAPDAIDPTSGERLDALDAARAPLRLHSIHARPSRL